MCEQQTTAAGSSPFDRRYQFRDRRDSSCASCPFTDLNSLVTGHYLQTQNGGYHDANLFLFSTQLFASERYPMDLIEHTLAIGQPVNIRPIRTDVQRVIVLPGSISAKSPATVLSAIFCSTHEKKSIDFCCLSSLVGWLHVNHHLLLILWPFLPTYCTSFLVALVLYLFPPPPPLALLASISSSLAATLIFLFLSGSISQMDISGQR